jgi:hypothetical protein
MFRIFKNKIFLTRGDSAIFTLSITDNDGNEYTPQDGDEITFTVKANTETRDILIQKDASSGKIEIQPEDTENLEYGNYVYDVQLKTADGYVDTIITPHEFKLEEEVTF